MKYLLVVFSGLIAAFTVMAEKNSQNAVRFEPCHYENLNVNEARTIVVNMKKFRFYPSQLTLEVCKPYRLVIKNSGKISHNFVAKEFFQSVVLKSGADELFSPPAPSFRGVNLVPRERSVMYVVPIHAGHFPLMCTHPYHASLGMVGAIEVIDTGVDSRQSKY